MLNTGLEGMGDTTLLHESGLSVGSKQIDFAPYRFIIIQLIIGGLATQKIISPVYLQACASLDIQTQIGLQFDNSYKFANMTYDGQIFRWASDSNIIIDIIGVK